MIQYDVTTLQRIRKILVTLADRRDIMMLADLLSESVSTTRATLDFLQNSSRYRDEKPYHCSIPLDAGQEHMRTNIFSEAREAREVSFIDIPSFKQNLDLETHGIQFMDSPFCFQFETSQSIDDVSCYLRHIAAMIKGHLKADHCFCYDHRVRSNTKCIAATRAVLMRTVSEEWSARAGSCYWRWHCQHSRRAGWTCSCR